MGTVVIVGLKSGEANELTAAPRDRFRKESRLAFSALLGCLASSKFNEYVERGRVTCTEGFYEVTDRYL